MDDQYLYRDIDDSEGKHDDYEGGDETAESKSVIIVVQKRPFEDTVLDEPAALWAMGPEPHLWDEPAALKAMGPDPHLQLLGQHVDLPTCPMGAWMTKVFFPVSYSLLAYVTIWQVGGALLLCPFVGGALYHHCQGPVLALLGPHMCLLLGCLDAVELLVASALLSLMLASRMCTGIPGRQASARCTQDFPIPGCESAQAAQGAPADLLGRHC